MGVHAFAAVWGLLAVGLFLHEDMSREHLGIHHKHLGIIYVSIALNVVCRSLVELDQLYATPIVSARTIPARYTARYSRPNDCRGFSFTPLATLPYTTSPYTTSPYTTSPYTPHPTRPHPTRPRPTRPRPTPLILHDLALHYLALHDLALHDLILHDLALHDLALHDLALHP